MLLLIYAVTRRCSSVHDDSLGTTVHGVPFLVWHHRHPCNIEAFEPMISCVFFLSTIAANRFHSGDVSTCTIARYVWCVVVAKAFFMVRRSWSKKVRRRRLRRRFAEPLSTNGFVTNYGYGLVTLDEFGVTTLSESPETFFCLVHVVTSPCTVQGRFTNPAAPYKFSACMQSPVCRCPSHLSQGRHSVFLWPGHDLSSHLNPKRLRREAPRCCFGSSLSSQMVFHFRVSCGQVRPL